VNAPLLRQIVQALLHETWPEGSLDLAIYLVSAPEITRLNETFLKHKGPTDVITFDYAETVGRASRLSNSEARLPPRGDKQDTCPTSLHGEIFVCLDEVVSQARRFHATWQSELVRYAVHGVLHLLGYNDQDRRARRRMKAAEDALVRRLARQFVFNDLSRT
jgi:probable rRNA maturation factor